MCRCSQRHAHYIFLEIHIPISTRLRYGQDFVLVIFTVARTCRYTNQNQNAFQNQKREPVYHYTFQNARKHISKSKSKTQTRIHYTFAKSHYTLAKLTKKQTHISA